MDRYGESCNPQLTCYWILQSHYIMLQVLRCHTVSRFSFLINPNKRKINVTVWSLILKLVIFVQEIIFLFIWNKSYIWEILSFSRHKHRLSDIQSGYILNFKFYTQIQTFTHWNSDKIWWKHPGQRSYIDKAVIQLHHQLRE